MRRLRMTLYLLMLALVLTACGGAPVLTVMPNQVDLGAIAADAPVTTTLQIRNSGQRPLTITGVRTSCGCTAATLSETNLVAGGATNLIITFDPQAHPGLYGPLLRVVYLASNDPEQPEVEIPVHVEILPPQKS
jgi:hypothetical protein